MAYDNFIPCFKIVVGEEGNYDSTYADKGNWTSGNVGVGKLNGTKYGISAAAYPTLDINTLTETDAQTIYMRDYWLKANLDYYPIQLAMLLFDACVNNGINRSLEWLQAAVGVATDGAIGPQTQAALTAALAEPNGCQTLCAEFMARRIDFMAQLPTWKAFGLGWSRRLANLPYLAMGLTANV